MRDDDDIDISTLEATVIVIGIVALMCVFLVLLVRWAFP